MAAAPNPSIPTGLFSGTEPASRAAKAGVPAPCPAPLCGAWAMVAGGSLEFTLVCLGSAPVPDATLSGM